MISPKEIQARARKLWMSGRPLRAWLGGEPLFPYAMPFRKPTAKEWLERFAHLRADVEQLEAASKTRMNAGYIIRYREVAHQKVGTLRVPDELVFESADDLAACAGQSEAMRSLKALAEALRRQEPRLIDWLAERPFQALEHEVAIPRLIAVASHFQAHPRPMRYAREMGIPGVDSKFIEAHQALLAEWLERLLPAEAVDSSVRGLADYGFERRFGLRYEEPLIRFRFLDASLALDSKIMDATVPLSQLAAYSPACDYVFVTENKINFLTLPERSRSLAIFGGGYAIDRLAGISWLKRTALHYWGDIDTHGFAILSRLRSFLPHARSFLMDRDTLLAHCELWSKEPEDRRCMRDLAALSADEQSVYDDLRNNRFGLCVRLEQEHVGYSYVAHAVESA